LESPERHNSISETFGQQQYAYGGQRPNQLTTVEADAAPTAPLQVMNLQTAGGQPPDIPFGAAPVIGPQPPRSRRSWKIYPIGALVLLILMLASFGVGHTLVGSSPSSASNGTSSGTSSISVPPSAQDLQQTIINVAHVVQPSVVEVTSLGQSSEAIGSGVILTSNGYIATNDHVVSGFTSFTVTLSNGVKEQAQLVGQDPQDDLAVLKIAANNLQPITFADSSQVQVGEFALAIGSPLGLADSTTFGIVSALNRTESEQPSGPASVLTGLIQTSAAINPGNSGGALVNLQGQLIGMPTLGATTTQNGTTVSGIGFAIPSNRIKFVTDQLIKSGKLTSTGQGFLGVQGQDVTPQLAASSGLSVQQGVLVSGFANDTAGNSPAQQAGLQAGDVIIAVNGQAISDNNDLASALLNQAPGTQVTLTVVNGSNQQTVKVTLGERPVSAQG